MAEGFVYVMTNASLAGQVKVGKTTRHPSQRAKELMTTGVPSAFVVEFAIFVADCDLLEETVHERLATHRVDMSREFFRIDVGEAVLAVSQEALCDHSLGVDDADMIVDDGDIAVVASKLGCHPFDIPRVFSFVSDGAWHDAYHKYRSWQADRLTHVSNVNKCGVSA